MQLFSDQDLHAFCDKYGLTYLGVFGSTARGEDRSDSDIDLAVEFDGLKTITLFDLGNMKVELQEKLGKKVDLVIRKNIKPILRPYIEKDLIPLYEKNSSSLSE